MPHPIHFFLINKVKPKKKKFSVEELAELENYDEVYAHPGLKIHGGNFSKCH
jgi:hypothetical protein